MGMKYNSNLSRAISVADYILEDGGHSMVEAAKEFRCSHSTIERDVNCLGVEAFYGNHPNQKELQQKYRNVQKTLKKLSQQASIENIKKVNAKRATSK